MVVNDTPTSVLDAAKCVGCGYALHGLTGRRCPECGRAFDPNDATTIWLPAALRPPVRRTPLPIAAMLGLVALGLTRVGYAREMDLVVLLGWLYWLGLTIGLIGTSVTGKQHAQPRSKRSRRVATACLLATVVMSSQSGSCPHATWVVVGPLSVTHAPAGRCGNPNGCPVCSVSLGGGWFLF